MDFAHTYRQLISDDVPERFLRAGPPLGLATSLTVLSKVEGVPLMTMSYPGTTLSESLATDAVPDKAQCVFGRERTRYLAWRRSVLDLQLCATGVSVDTDPIEGLQRLARIELGPSAANPFYELRRVLAGQVVPSDLTRELAIPIEARLVGLQRSLFRGSLCVLDRLQASDLAVGTGLLPQEPIGPLPCSDDHRARAPLPPTLEKEFGAAPKPLRTALPFVYRLALLCELVEPGADLSIRDLVSTRNAACLANVDPMDYGFERPSKATLGQYLQRLVRHAIPVRAPARKSPDPVVRAWGDFRDELKRRGEHSLALRSYSVSRHAIPAKLRPCDLTPEWIQATEKLLPPADLSAFRSTMFGMDGLLDREDFPRSLLPGRKSGLVKKVRKKAVKKDRKKTEPADPVAKSWIEFFAALRKNGRPTNELNAMYAIRSAALLERLYPRDVDRKFCLAVFANGNRATRSSVHIAVRVMDGAAVDADLKVFRPGPLIGALPDGRKAYDDLPNGIETELVDVAKVIGYGDSTLRTLKVAAKALLFAASESALRPVGTLRDLLELDFDLLAATDEPSSQADTYRKSLGALRDFLALPWTPAWRALYAAISAAGVTSSRNPVRQLLKYAAGREPHVLDLMWVQDTERYLRRPNELSRHGRADLAKTFLGSVERLEALRTDPGFSGVPLLPSGSLMPA